jgi:hypothetical protein
MSRNVSLGLLLLFSLLFSDQSPALELIMGADQFILFTQPG